MKWESLSTSWMKRDNNSTHKNKVWTTGLNIKKVVQPILNY